MAFKTSAAREKLEELAIAEGCEVIPKASYTLVKKGKSKNCLFIAKTKEVSRIDIGGFNVQWPETVKDLGGEKHGCVHQQMRADVDNVVFLDTFRKLCRGLDTFESHPKKDRQRPHAFKGTKKKKMESVVIVSAEESPRETLERLVKKLDLIKEVARQKGAPVHSKTLRELTEQIEKARKQVTA